MVGVVPIIGLTLALEAVADGWGHPGYAETALYLGIALLGLRAAAQASEAWPLQASAAAPR